MKVGIIDLKGQTSTRHVFTFYRNPPCML